MDLVESDGPSTTSCMIKLLDRLKNFRIWSEFDPIPDGPMAHQITDAKVRKLIQEKYDQLYKAEPTPYTHPENYDPFNPPAGWAYDPYYECWLETHETR